MTDRDLAKSDAEGSRKLRKKLEVEHELVVAERATLAESRRSLEEEKAIHLGHISLLLRATDDDAGLELRPTETAFQMTTSKMTTEEQEVCKRPWADPLFEMARRLAETLDHIRNLVQRLMKREQEVDKREAAIAAKEVTFAASEKNHDNELKAHRAAISALETRQKQVDALEERAKSLFENSAKAVRHAEQSEKAARSALSLHEEWVEVVDVLRAKPGEVSVIGGRIHISPKAIEQFPEKIFDVIDAPAPRWVQKVVSERHLIFRAQHHANEKEQAALSFERELQSFLNENKMALTQDQERALAVSKAKLQSIEAFRQGMDGPCR